jgi:hypothetical protein
VLPTAALPYRAGLLPCHDDGVALLTDPVASVLVPPRLRAEPVLPAGGVVSLPVAWRPVPGSAIDTGMQRFTAFQRAGDGPRAELHQTAGLVPSPAGRTVAAITLGTLRVTVHDEPGRGGFEARWHGGGADWRLACAPVTLLEFLELLHSADWPR